MKTPFETSPPGSVSMGRVQLVLATPLALLLVSTFITWIWRAVGLPGIVGGASPLGALVILVVVFGGVYATHRRLPITLFTWFPSGLAGVALLGGILAVEGDTGAATFSTPIIFPIVFIFTVAVSIAISKAGAYYGVAFAAIVFLAHEAHRFPLFSFDASGPVAAATLLTFLAAGRAVLEMGALLLLIYRLFLNPIVSTTKTTFLLVLLVLAHGPLTAWEQPLILGEGLTSKAYFANSLGWLILAGFAMSMVGIFSRLRRSWFVEAARVAAERAARSLDVEEPVADVTTPVVTSSASEVPEGTTETPSVPLQTRRLQRRRPPEKRPETFRRRRR